MKVEGDHDIYICGHFVGYSLRIIFGRIICLRLTHVNVVRGNR
jgi:hypothetical protein